MQNQAYYKTIQCIIICIGCWLLCTCNALHAQDLSTEEWAVRVVQEQLEAYNRKDLDRFLAVFDEDAEIFNLGQEKPIGSGKTQLREIYGRLFEGSPNLHSEVVNRSVIGNKVIDYEIITGRQGQDGTIHIVAIYLVENQLIKQCYFIRK